MQLNFQPFPDITTQRLVLRQFQETDKPSFFAMRSDKGVMKYIPRPIAQTMEDLNPLLELIEELRLKNEAINWVMALPENNQLIGTIGLYRIQKENYRTEIGYMLLPQFEKNGYVHEAMQAVLDFAFSTLQFHSVFAVIDPRNDASRKVLQKINFIKEGFFKQDFCFENIFYDSEYWAILQTEFIKPL